MPHQNYTNEEIASRGEAIYAKHIRDKVENKHKGKYAVIDIESGEYEIDPDDLMATKRMLARRPDAILYAVRIGFPTAYQIGKNDTVMIR